MSFTMAQYLQDYRKEDITAEKEIIKTKWKKTVAVIKEAFSDKYVNVAEAKRIIINEFAKEDCPATIDQKFLKENLDYIIEKVENLSEGDIRIIINNGNKEPKVKSADVDEIDEAKGKKAKKKSKKDDEEDLIPEPDGEEVIVDEPTDADAIAVSTAEAPESAEVLITFDKDSKTLSVKEGEEVIEEFAIEDQDALKQVVEFLKDFYSKHDYIVNEEGIEDIGEVEKDEGEKEGGEGEESEGEKEGEEGEASEGLEGSEGSEGSEDEKEIEEYALPESKGFTFADLLLEEEEAEVVEEAEVDKPKCSDLVGKAVEVKDKWYTVQSCDDSNMLKVLDKDGQSSVVDIKDVTDWEKDIVKNPTVSEGAKKVPMSWLKGKKPTTGKSSAMTPETSKKKDVKSQGLTKVPMKKTGQKVLTVKVPKMVKKGESNKALTKTPMKSTGSKVPAIKKVTVTKKDAPTGSFSKNPMKKTGQKVPSIKPQSIPKKDATSGSWSKKPSKPQEKIEKVKAPKL